jgi:hypothetical protein
MVSSISAGSRQSRVDPQRVVASRRSNRLAKPLFQIGAEFRQRSSSSM